MDATSAAIPARRGFGVAGDLPAGVVRDIARAAQEAGYDTLWVNDGPSGEGLGALQPAAETTTDIGLAVGLLPLDRWTPRRIAERIAELGLPVRRLTVGVGAGAGRDGPARVRRGVHALRDMTDARVVVGALGPRMCRLAGEIADGVLLDWPTARHARACAGMAEDAARAVGRPRPAMAGYVFTALGDPARRRLRGEAEHYAAVPAYAAHFRRMGVAPSEASVAGETPAQVRRGLQTYASALDETVVRACVGEDTAAEYLRLLDATAPTA